MPVAPIPPQLPARAAIFDMDGLLVDSEPLWREVTVEVLDAIGSDVRPILDRGLTKGMRVDESVALFRRLAPWPGAGSAPGDEPVVERVVAGVVLAIGERAVLLPGAAEALARFAAEGFRMALASGSSPEVIEAVLARFDLGDRFEVVTSAVEVPLGKPHPAILLRTAEVLEAEPAECVVLEDSLNGCIAAKAARMRVIAVPAAEERDDPRFAIADVVLSSLEEITSPAVADVLGIGLGTRV